MRVKFLAQINSGSLLWGSSSRPTAYKSDAVLTAPPCTIVDWCVFFYIYTLYVLWVKFQKSYGENVLNWFAITRNTYQIELLLTKALEYDCHHHGQQWRSNTLYLCVTFNIYLVSILAIILSVDVKADIYQTTMDLYETNRIKQFHLFIEH